MLRLYRGVENWGGGQIWVGKCGVRVGIMGGGGYSRGRG